MRKSEPNSLPAKPDTQPGHECAGSAPQPPTATPCDLSSVSGIDSPADIARRTAFNLLESYGIDVWFRISREMSGFSVQADGVDRQFMQAYTDLVSVGEDPLIRHCLGTGRTFFTGADSLPTYQYLARDERSFVADAADATGASIGISPGDLCGGNVRWNLLSTQWTRADAMEIRETHLHSLLNALQALEAFPPPSLEVLSGREVECLTQIARGERVARIAESLSLSQVTVELHLRNARAKLKARTRDQAVALAVQAGLITI